MPDAGARTQTQSRRGACLDTDSFQIFPDGKGDFLLNIGEPSSLEFYSHGRTATWDELMQSIESGFPLLAEMAEKEEGAMTELNEAKITFLTLAKKIGTCEPKRPESRDAD